MSLLSEFLSNVFDSICAPASAFDSHSDAFHSSLGSTVRDSGFNSAECGADWHNNFGTAADYQVPAESGYSYSSSDWSSSGSDWGSGSSGSMGGW